MTEATKTAKNTNKEKVVPETLGNGIFSANILSSWTATEKKLLSLKWEQPVLNFIRHTIICSKGHEEHMRESKALKMFFPDMTPAKAKSQVNKCLNKFMTLLYSGLLIEENLAKYEASKVKPKSTRPRKTAEEKAEIAAEKELKKAFRQEKANLLKAYLEKNMPNAKKLILAESK